MSQISEAFSDFLDGIGQVRDTILDTASGVLDLVPQAQAFDMPPNNQQYANAMSGGQPYTATGSGWLNTQTIMIAGVGVLALALVFRGK